MKSTIAKKLAKDYSPSNTELKVLIAHIRKAALSGLYETTLQLYHRINILKIRKLGYKTFNVNDGPSESVIMEVKW